MKAFLAAVLGVVLTSTLAAADESLVPDQSLTTIAAPGPNSVVTGQWVQLDADGSVSGAVVAPSGRPAATAGQVTLVGKSGEAITADVDAHGQFLLPDVAPGVYAISYMAEEAFATYALQVVEPRDDATLSTSTTIVASTLSPNRARTTIARYQPVRVELEPSVESAGPLPVPNTASRLESYYQVNQTAAGGLEGRLIQAGSVAGGMMPAAKVNVLMIQDGNVVGQAISAADGTFEVADLAPGFYNMIASGDAGFAALGFELVPSTEPIAARAGSNPFRLANATLQDRGGRLEVQLAPPSVDLLGGGPGGPPPFAGPGAPPLGPPMQPGFAGGGFGGGGGGLGGGGGGLGGGGIGGLAALGGIAAAIAIAASSDDDDDDFRPQPASPGRPPFNPPGPPFNPPGPPPNAPPF